MSSLISIEYGSWRLRLDGVDGTLYAGERFLLEVSCQSIRIQPFNTPLTHVATVSFSSDFRRTIQWNRLKYVKPAVPLPAEFQLRTIYRDVRVDSHSLCLYTQVVFVGDIPVHPHVSAA
jgi:hypothetical protein